MNRYYKNFILCGDIEQYCLLCKESFHLITDIEKHVRLEKHRRSAQEISCMRQFQKDLIYKLQRNYYCAICNLIVKNLATVKKHVKTTDHKFLKQRPDAITKKPVGTINAGYITIDKIVLNMLEWNSIKGNTCHICHVSLENIKTHIASEEHIIRLIQCPSNYTNNQYYRKLTNENFHCFACKKIFFAPNFIEHWIRCENNDHKQIRQLRESRDQDAVNATQGTSKMARAKIEVIQSLQGHYTIDEAENIATCKHCPDTMSINFRPMMKHIKDMHISLSGSSSEESDKEVKKVRKSVPDSGLRRFELAKYGEKMFIKLNYNGSRGYCKLCDKYVPPHINHFKIHCKGIRHRGYLEIIGLKKPKLRNLSLSYDWKSFKSYITSVQNSASEPTFWINKNFFVDIDSFFFIRGIQVDPHYKKIKCLACIDVMEADQVYDHCMSIKHRALFGASKIISKSGEFIREVKPHFYHCGFCNLTFPYSKVLEDHLRTKKHILARETKTLLAKVGNFVDKFNPNFIDVSVSYDDLYSRLIDLAGNIGSK